MTTRIAHDIRYEPLYGMADISRYARVPLPTLKTWVYGPRALIVPPVRDTVSSFSFINLIEAHVIGALRRKHGVPLAGIRKAIRFLREKQHADHPLAEVDLEVFGRNIVVDHRGIKVTASAGGQIAIAEVIKPYLKRVEWDEAHLPARFFPFTYDACPKTIVMDPLVDYGRPVIKGTRIATVTIFERYSAGEGLSVLAKDYDVALSYVEEALRCEIERRAA